MANTRGTVPTPITDKNGKQTTVHKLPTKEAKLGRAVNPAPVDADREAKKKAIEESLKLYNSAFKRSEHGDLLDKTVDLVLSTPASLHFTEAFEQTKTQAKELGYGQFWYVILKRAKKYHTEFVPTDGVNYLELDDEDKSLPWADRYKVKLAKLVASEGKIMSENYNQYGWTDDVYLHHLNPRLDGCHIAEVTSLIEDEWSEFNDTVVGNSEHQGVQADAQCACGWFRGKIRAEGTLDDFIQTMNGKVGKDDVFDGATSDYERDRIEAEERARKKRGY